MVGAKYQLQNNIAPKATRCQRMNAGRASPSAEQIASNVARVRASPTETDSPRARNATTTILITGIGRTSPDIRSGEE